MVKLPIELLVFDGEVQAKGNYVYWVTATEIDNDFFTLERSFDGNSFEEVAYIDGAGNSIVNLSYDFMDVDARQGSNFYRLRQTDFNGTNTVSETIELFREFDDNLITISPIPADYFVTVTLESSVEKEVNLGVYDITGKEIIYQEVDVVEGINTVELSLETLSSGVYFLTIVSEQGDDMKTRKFIKN